MWGASFKQTADPCTLTTHFISAAFPVLHGNKLHGVWWDSWIQGKKSIRDLNCIEMWISRNILKHYVSRFRTPKKFTVSLLFSLLYSSVTFKWGREVFRKMVCMCSQIFLIRTVYTSPSFRFTALKKILQYTLTVLIYLQSTIPRVPSRSLLFQILLVFILVACCFLTSGPTCSCCSSPYRWNKQESLSHSQEYSWSVDWPWWGSSRSLRASGSSDSSMGAGRGSSVVSKLLRLHRKFLPAEPCWVQA